MLENISIILVEPQGDENVGMAARAMKNCGITDLRLVNPKAFKTRAAYKWACNAADVLLKTKVFPTLKEAVSDASLIVGLTRREGHLRPPAVEARTAPSTIASRAKNGRVALLFGREDDGLRMNELNRCDLVWTIPTSKHYPSLNLAQAVLIACHEIFKKQRSPSTLLGAGKEAPRLCSGQAKKPLDSARGKEEIKKREEDGTGRDFVSKDEVRPILKRMSDMLEKLGYDDRDNGKLRRKIIKSFEELFGRGGLRRKDVNMFLGLISRIREMAQK